MWSVMIHHSCFYKRKYMMHGSFVNGGGPISISELIKSKRNRKPWVSCFSFSFYDMICLLVCWLILLSLDYIYKGMFVGNLWPHLFSFDSQNTPFKSLKMLPNCLLQFLFLSLCNLSISLPFGNWGRERLQQEKEGSEIFWGKAGILGYFWK